MINLYDELKTLKHLKLFALKDYTVLFLFLQKTFFFTLLKNLLNLINSHFILFFINIFYFISPINKAALFLKIPHKFELDVECRTSCKETFVMISESLVINLLFILILNKIMNFLLPPINILNLLIQFHNLVRLKLKIFGFLEQISQLLFFVCFRLIIILFLAFLPHSCLFYNYSILNSFIEIFSLGSAFLYLSHELLEVNRDVFAILVYLIYVFEYSWILISKLNDLLLPMFGFLNLLL